MVLLALRQHLYLAARGVALGLAFVLTIRRSYIRHEATGRERMPAAQPKPIRFCSMKEALIALMLAGRFRSR